MPRRCRLLLVAAIAVACDTGITPPADVPILALSARTVAMVAPKGSTIPDSATVIVSNNGRGTLTGLTLTAPSYQDSVIGWLSAVLQDTTIVLAASAEHLIVQTTYTATLGVLLPAADSSPRTITVTFEVGQTQQITLSDTAVTFAAVAGGAVPPSQTITVTNGGTGILSELRDPTVTATWLSATLGSPTAPAQVDVVPSTIPGTPGTYQAMVVVSSRIAEPESDTVTVTLVVADPPTLSLAADTIVLDATEDDSAIVRRLRVREAKLRPLSGLAVGAPTRPWLAATLAIGTSPDTLTLTAIPDSLYTATDTSRILTDTARVLVSSAGGGSRTLAVVLRVRRGPTVRAATRTVSFTMYHGGPPPAPQVVSVRNDGAGTLAGLDTLGGPPAWLQASLDAPTAPAALTLTVDSTGLGVGQYSGNVVIRSAGQRWDTVSVGLTVRAGPSLVVASDTVTFRADSGGATPDAVLLTAGNAGPGELHGWSAALGAPAPWLSWALDTTVAPARLTLQPATTAGLPLGTVETNVHVSAASAGGSPQTVTVRFVLDNPLPADAVWLSADTVRLIAPLDASDLPTAVLGVTYTGSGQPAVQSAPAWLMAGLTAGNTALTLTVNPAGLPPSARPGTVTGQVVVGRQTITTSVPVRLTVTGASVRLAADTVRFRAYQGQSPWPAAQRIQIANGGADTLKELEIGGYTTGVRVWLDATLDSTTAPTGLSLQPGQFDVPGSHQATLIVSSPTGVGKDTVRVSSVIDTGPAITASPDRLALAAAAGGPADADTVVVLNTGSGAIGTLQQPVSSQPWLRAHVDSTAALPRLVVEADPAGLSAGTRTGRLTLLSTQAGTLADTVRVTFETVPPPSIHRSPSALAFHVLAGDPVPADTQAVTVFDPAGRPTGALTVTPVGDAAWLHVEPASGTAPATFRVWPIAVPPASDTAYVATIRITGSLAPDTLTTTVRYYVDLGRSPAIVLSRDSLVFDRPNPPAQTVKITNGGSGTLRELSVRETTGADWLFVLFDNRIAPATLTVAVDPAKAADEPANSVARLEITGAGAQPRTITVTLR